MKRPASPIEIAIEDPAWRKLGRPFRERIEEAAELALKQKSLSSPASRAVARRGKGTQVSTSRRVSPPGSPSLARSFASRSPGMTILLTSDARLRELNATFRGQDKPTNVLAFPAGEPGYLGDIAIAHGVAAKEAKAARKRLIDHAAHLVVHGALHLLGYDHVRVREAKVMEALETSLLANLGIADPYAKAKR